MLEALEVTIDNTTPYTKDGLIDYLFDIISKEEGFQGLLSVSVTLGNYGAEEEVHRAIIPQDIKDVLHFKEVERQIFDSIIGFLGVQDIVLSQVYLPFNNFNELDPVYELGDVLALFRSVHITNSFLEVHRISTSHLSQKDLALSFSQCVFKTSWNLSDYKFSSERGYIYSNCEFASGLFFYVSKQLKYELIKFEGSQFFRCRVFCSIDVNNAHFLSDLFVETECIDMCSAAKELRIDNVIVEGNFELNGASFDSVALMQSRFNSKFKLVKSEAKELEILDVDFGKGCSFFQTEFGVFNIKKSTFFDYTIFEECKFGLGTDNQNPSLFTFVTFERFSNFRSAIFASGLNIDKTNFLEPPNFLGAQVPIEGSSRETFRIIKHSFDSVGNYLEANNFFAREMECYRFELSKEKGLYIEKSIFWFNSLFSNFGQSIWRPVTGIIVTSILAAFVYSDFVDKLPLWVINGDSTLTRYLIGTLNNWADGLVFSSILKDGYEFISLFFGILLSVFTWMTIVAFKRLTKR